MPGLLAPGASEVCPRPGGAQRHCGLGLCRAPSLGAGRLNHPAQCHYGRRHAEAVDQDQITSRIALQVASVARPLDPHETLVAAVPDLERTLKCVLQGLADAPCDMDVGGRDVCLSGAIAHHHEACSGCRLRSRSSSFLTSLSTSSRCFSKNGLPQAAACWAQHALGRAPAQRAQAMNSERRECISGGRAGRRRARQGPRRRPTTVHECSWTSPLTLPAAARACSSAAWPTSCSRASLTMCAGRRTTVCIRHKLIYMRQGTSGA